MINQLFGEDHGIMESEIGRIMKKKFDKQIIRKKERDLKIEEGGSLIIDHHLVKSI